MQTSYSAADEVAEFFHVKKPTIRLWTRQGMPCLRVGRLVRFKIDEVEKWLRERSNTKTNGNGHVDEQ